MTEGSELIAAERKRQVEGEGYTAEHDKGHAAELIAAGVAYAKAADSEARWPEMGPSPYPVDEDTGQHYFPWAPAYWKPTGDPVRDLVKAGALIAAAIDSLQADGVRQCPCGCGHSWERAVLDMMNGPGSYSREQAEERLEKVAAAKAAAQHRGVQY